MPIVVAINKIDLPGREPRPRQGRAGAGRPAAGGVGRDDAVRRGVGEDAAEPRRPAREDPARRRRSSSTSRANPNAEASGPIIESRLDVGRGPVATMLVHRGTLKVGDAIVAGDAHGRVRALYDYKGEKIQEARCPASPVEILGFDKPPPAGEVARVVENERAARELAHARVPSGCAASSSRRSARTRRLAREAVRADADGRGRRISTSSSRATSSARSRRSSSELAKIRALRGARERHPPGRRRRSRENDIMLASASDALIVGFNVRPNVEARELAGARGRRDPHLQRHLPAHRRDRAGARRHARHRQDRGDDRRGGGARPLQGLAARHDRGLHGHERRRAPQRRRARRPRRHRHLRRRRSRS